MQAAVARVDELESALLQIEATQRAASSRSRVQYQNCESEIVVSQLNLYLPGTDRLMLPKGQRMCFLVACCVF
jgi:hypothetical protein